MKTEPKSLTKSVPEQCVSKHATSTIQSNPTTARTRRCRGRPLAERGGKVGRDAVPGAHLGVGQVLQPVQGLLDDDGEGGGGCDQGFHRGVKDSVTGIPYPPFLLIDWLILRKTVLIEYDVNFCPTNKNANNAVKPSRDAMMRAEADDDDYDYEEDEGFDEDGFGGGAMFEAAVEVGYEQGDEVDGLATSFEEAGKPDVVDDGYVCTLQK
ncbi:hypothetical protein RHSIM_Rhsim03G0130800 [Rhododendron simsii]|uniref:Uncharacterized protein n=1 Tax=Rhododendron simsii TaxID=118357 RepID=A0A834H7N8_RHOSS|nr:hypothetical protein RHSIM_Rhsim03G0130800 [Rhododendron simsii]